MRSASRLEAAYWLIGLGSGSSSLRSHWDVIWKYMLGVLISTKRSTPWVSAARTNSSVGRTLDSQNARLLPQGELKAAACTIASWS